MKITTNVENLPTNINEYLAKNNGVLWITATPYEGYLWYHDLWYTEVEAQKAAWNDRRIVLKMEA